MKINCPLCGSRPNSEFTIKGDAINVRPNFDLTSGMGDGQAWHDYVYLRDNHKGVISEFWHHSSGCRSWLKVERNNVSHQVLSVQLACQRDKQEVEK